MLLHSQHMLQPPPPQQQGARRPLAITFGQQVQEEVDELKDFCVGRGSGQNYTDFMVANATAYMAKDKEVMESSKRGSLWPPLLQPGACISDGGKGITGAFTEWWPSVQQYGDYAHIYFHMAEGRYLAKNHDWFEWVLKEVIPQMHTCPTTGAWDMLREHLAGQWRNDSALMAVHTRLFGSAVNPWYIGISEVGGVTPSNQEQEVCGGPCVGPIMCIH